MQLLCDFEAQGLQVDEVSMSAVVSACEEVKDAQKGKKTVKNMVSCGKYLIEIVKVWESQNKTLASFSKESFQLGTLQWKSGGGEQW